MAIYKPNNFYPYMQEVDLESDEGVIFSCQANTDGGSMVRAARLRILDKDKNVVLYEKIQNLDYPVKNGEIVEFKLEPYVFDSNNSISFISLTPDININERVNYCPYNFYQNQIYGFDKFILSLSTKIYSEDPEQEIEYSWYPCFDYNVKIINNEYFLFDRSDTKISEIIKITLKNNKEYIWQIDLFEHELNSIDFNATYVNNGTITGSTGPILWINKKNQNSDIILNLQDLTDDYYVEYDLNEFNSDIYQDKLNEGFTLSGELTAISTNISEENEELMSEWKGNFFWKKDDNKRWDYYGDYKISLMQNIGFGNVYYYDENNRRRIKENIIDYNLSLIEPINSQYENVTISYPRIYQSATSNSYDNARPNDNLNGIWYYVYDFSIYKEEDTIKLDLSDSYVGNTNDDICFAWGSHSNSSSKRIDDYSKLFFATKTAETTVIANCNIAKEYFSDDYEEFEFIKSDGTIITGYKYKNEEIHEINGIIYRTRLLTPLPLYKRVNSYRSSFEYYIDHPTKMFKFDENNQMYSDIDCLKNHYPNCIEDFYFKSFNWDSIYNYSIVLNNDLTLDIHPYGISSQESYSQSIIIESNSNYKIEFITTRDTSIPNLSKTIDLNLFDDKSLNSKKIKIDLNKEKVMQEEVNQDTGYVYNKNNYFSNTDILETYYIYSQEINVDKNFIEPVLNIEITSYEFTDLKIIKIPIIIEDLMVSDSTIPDIDFNSLYLNISTDATFLNKNDIESYLISSLINNVIILEDDVKQNEIFSNIVDKGTKYYYYLSVKDRERISYFQDNIGTDKNFFKIELENDIPYNIKDTEEINIYNGGNDNSYNSFFGVKNSEFNIDNLYVRFPGYVGKDASGNQIYDVIPYSSGVKEGFDDCISPYVSKYIKHRKGKATIDAKSDYIDDAYGLQGWFIPNNLDEYRVFSYNESSGAKFEDYNNYNDFTIYNSYTQTLSPLGYIPYSLYGKNVRPEAFEVQENIEVIENYNDSENLIQTQYNTVYCKLFKVTSYNYETGEFVIAGGLDRKILNTDSYELWEANIIEGSSNEYDITEVISSYSRVYPDPATDKIAKIGQESDFSGPLTISNSSKNLLFIQPNINLLYPEYNYSYLKLLRQDLNNNLIYKYKKQFFTIFDRTINKLDDSQWLINNNVRADVRIGDDYELYMDCVQSSTNYFYGRSLDKLSLFAIPVGEIDINNIENIENIKDIYSFNYNVVDVYSIISSMDFYIVGIYNNKEILKRYIVKIYNSNMELIYNSNDVNNSYIKYYVSGLNNNEEYYMTIECENELGNITVYDQMFVTQYLEQESQEIKLNVETDCQQSGVIISFVDENNNYCTIDNFINNEIDENAIIKIYRKSQDGNIKWIYDIDLQNSKVFYDYFDTDYKYSFIDYNVGNDERYEYYAVLKFIQTSDTVNSYLFAKGEVVTNFDSWTLVNIIEDQDGLYSAIGDVWSFRYNLESEDLVQNTSTTTWDTLGRYGQVGKGEKNYISSGLRCLLGDISYYNTYSSDNQIVKKYGYNEKYENIEKKVTVNNITKYKKWQKFCNSFSKKLLKDLKGNKWIVQIIENPPTSNADNSKEQLYTISFNWQEVLDSEQISVCNKLEDIKQDIDTKTKIERLDYYNDENVIPTSETSFIFEIDNETMTASIALLDQSSVYNTSKKMTMANIKTGLNEIVVPYKYNKEGNEYLVTNIKDNGFNNKNLKSVILPNSIKNIGISSFANNKDLINITIPNSVETIGNNAFENCISLNNITIPEKIININNGVFNHCESLTEIVIPFGVISIEQNAFSYCKKLNNIKIPYSINFIGDSAFEGCESLTEVIIPDKITSINNSIFKDCTLLKNITIPNTVTNISEKAFYNCNQLLNITDITRVIKIGNSAFEGCFSLTSFTIPNGVTYINNSTFKNCSGLMNINIHNGITSIGDSAFFGCVGLNTIDIPENVTSIGISAFEGCSGLSSIIIPENISSISDNIFKNCTSLNTLLIPENVTSIGISAFEGCSGLSSIISQHEFEEIKDRAFIDCNNLETTIICDYYTYSISGGEASIRSVSTDISGDSTIILSLGGLLVNNIKDFAFESCTNLTSIRISENIINIGDGIFKDCSKLMSISVDENNENYCSVDGVLFDKNITTLIQYPMGNNTMTYSIPDKNITIINSYAFYNCMNLTEIILPINLEIIKEYSFEGCNNLNTVYYKKDENSWSDILIENNNDILTENKIEFNSYRYLTEDDNIEYEINDSGIVLTSVSTDITGNIIIPENLYSYNVVGIGDNCFKDCSNIVGIKSEANIENIGDNAFNNCSNLINLELNEEIKNIGDNAFNNCSKISKIIIPDGTILGNNEFTGCTNLNSLYYNYYTYSISGGEASISSVSTNISGDIEVPSFVDIYEINTINRYAFKDCIQIISIIMPDTIINIDWGIFKGCIKLEKIKLSNNITSIVREMFYNCTNLKEINIHENITSIEYLSFYYCSSLINIVIPNSVTSISPAFYGCNNIESMTLPCSHSINTNRGFGSIFNVDNDELPESLKEVIITNEKLTYISDFENCINLETIIIPNSITTIEYNAFYNCENLINIGTKDLEGNIVLSDAITYVGPNAFANTKWYEQQNGCIYIGKVLYAYKQGKLIEPEITINDGTTQITANAFIDCSYLESIKIPDTVTIIEYAAFENCSNLKEVILSKNITRIDICTFKNCSSLENIMIPESVISIGESAFEGCLGLTSVEIPEFVTYIGYNVFYGCKNLTDVTIYCTVIPVQMFKNCSNLQNINMLGSVSYIGFGAFEGCESLEQINLPNSVNNINDNAFGNCIMLKNITIPDGATIGSEVFYGCTNLTEIIYNKITYSISNNYATIYTADKSITGVIIPETIGGIIVNRISYHAFYNCNLQDIIIPNNIELIGDGAFDSCSLLERVEICDGIKNISSGMFYGCTLLDYIIIPESVIDIGNSAFYGCNDVTVYYKGTEEQWGLINIGGNNERLYKEGSIIYNY